MVARYGLPKEVASRLGVRAGNSFSSTWQQIGSRRNCAQFSRHRERRLPGRPRPTMDCGLTGCMRLGVGGRPALIRYRHRCKRRQTAKSHMRRCSDASSKGEKQRHDKRPMRSSFYHPGLRSHWAAPSSVPQHSFIARGGEPTFANCDPLSTRPIVTLPHPARPRDGWREIHARPFTSGAFRLALLPPPSATLLEWLGAEP